MECFVFKGVEIKTNASEMRLRICSDECSQNIISFIQILWFFINCSELRPNLR